MNAMAKTARLLMHYAIPSENLPELATIGVARVAIFGFRCEACEHDFHISEMPHFCPFCGIVITGEKNCPGPDPVFRTSLEKPR